MATVGVKGLRLADKPVLWLVLHSYTDTFMFLSVTTSPGLNVKCQKLLHSSKRSAITDEQAVI